MLTAVRGRLLTSRVRQGPPPVRRLPLVAPCATNFSRCRAADEAVAAAGVSMDALADADPGADVTDAAAGANRPTRPLLSTLQLVLIAPLQRSSETRPLALDFSSSGLRTPCGPGHVCGRACWCTRMRHTCLDTRLLQCAHRGHQKAKGKMIWIGWSSVQPQLHPLVPPSGHQPA